MIWMRAWTGLLAAAGLLAATAVRAEDSSPDYIKGAGPILMAHCAECHRPGQIGPMSLLSYDEVRPWVKSIRKTVAERTMPPWFADPAHGKFREAMVLSAAEIETITRWADAGAPRGEGPEPVPPQFAKDGWRMKEIDQIFEMPEPFVLPDSLEDEYHNFIVPTNLTEDKWVVGTELLPGAADVVHHILVFLSPPGSDPNAAGEGGRSRFSSGGLNSGLFAKYGPGANPEVWHDGRGRLLPAGTNFVFQMHYHKEPGAGTSRTDRSRIALKFADKPVEHPITTAWIADPTFSIPPGADNHPSVSVFEFKDAGHIYSLAPHMHLRGKDFLYEAVYPGGEKEILLNVPRYNFNWQISYIFEQPKSIPKGTIIRAVAHWDNSAANPHNPDPGKTVTWGSPTTDEMMIGFMDYTYETLKNEQEQYGVPEGKEYMRELFALRSGGEITFAKLLKIFDKNGDGMIQLAEADLPPQFSRILENADRNRDGALDAAEGEGFIRLFSAFGRRREGGRLRPGGPAAARPGSAGGN